MNKLPVYAFSILLLGWMISMGFCHKATCPDCTVAKAAIIPPVEKTPEISISIDDEILNFVAATSDNLLFAKNTCEYSTPLSVKLQTVFRNTVQHLNNNPNRILALTGLYDGTENNTCSAAADLGIARAEQVKQLLVQMGAPHNRIRLEGSNIESLQTYKERYVGAIDYNFIEEAVEVRLRANNITLYFDTNKQEINLTDNQRVYFDELKAYLVQNPNAKASVTGHTDDRGNDKGNIRLSRKRSEFVRDYMIEQGIIKKQIFNKGMGPDSPITTNESREGRALNRRVEITLQ